MNLALCPNLFPLFFLNLDYFKWISCNYYKVVIQQHYRNCTLHSLDCALTKRAFSNSNMILAEVTAKYSEQRVQVKSFTEISSAVHGINPPAIFLFCTSNTVQYGSQQNKALWVPESLDKLEVKMWKVLFTILKKIKFESPQ